MSTQGHNPGAFKKPAKAHKSWKGKRTKGEIDSLNRGRLGVRDITRNRNRSVSKEERRNQLSQQRSLKRRNALEERRKFLGAGAPPTLTTIIALGSCGSPNEFLNQFSRFDESIIRKDSHNVTYFLIPRFKARVGFLTPNPHSLDDVFDCLKVSDVLVLVWPVTGELSEFDELLLSAVKAHGLPTLINIVPGMGSAAIPSGKKREEVRMRILSIINKWSLSTDKVLTADSDADGIQIIRTIVETKKKKLLIQKRRSHLLVEKLDVAGEENGVCTLLATGYLRGPAFNVNRLVHIQGWGDFQIGQIDQHADPNTLKQNVVSPENKVIATADKNIQESLQAEIVPDPLDGEQTWPDEHDLKDAGDLNENQERKRVPKGTSSYQAAWILDSEDEADDNDDDEDEDMEDESDEEDIDDIQPAHVEEEEMEDVPFDDTATEAGSEYMDDADIDMGEVDKYRKERENAQFPDEIDTPIDVPARVRFQKYRGLKSFRTSPWDPLENLPYDYARIFKFQNFKKTRKNVLLGIDKDEAGQTASSGCYVTIHIEKVPTTFCNEWNSSAPLVLYQLLPHEQKMSIVNLTLRKHPSCTLPIVGKQKLIFYIGFRKFEAQPIFSQHTNGDKFKMERFMPDTACVASIFAPITFPPSTVLVFREDAKGRQEIVATGSVLDNNPDRVVLKRIVLAGHPFKINKRSVVCRYMFFNREDIEWFKPVEVYTPTGRRGHIKEPIGTHGHMKLRFDQQLNAQDSVMMSLYKRAFPKWTYNPRVPRLAPTRLAEGDEHNME